MATRKTVDQILDKAADILEKDGWVTDTCYDNSLGSYCALGAIAKAVYPKLANDKLGDVAYPMTEVEAGKAVDPRHLQAVEFLAKRITKSNKLKPWQRLDDSVVYRFNDGLPNGMSYDNFDRLVVDEKIRFKSSRRVVSRLRNAAKAYRKQQEKA